MNCRRQNEQCDYGLRLNWGGRTRRPSITSPSSPPSDDLTQLPAFLLPPSAPSQEASHFSAFSSNIWEETAAADSPAELLCWDSAFAEEMNIRRTYPSRLHDIQVSPAVPDQSFHPSHRTADRAPVEMDLSREQEVTIPFTDGSGHSKIDAPANSQYQIFSESAYVPPILEFSSHHGPISQPILSDRPVLHAPAYDPSHSSLMQNNPPKYQRSATLPADDSPNTLTISHLDWHQAASPQSPDTSIFTPGTPRNVESPDSFSSILEAPSYIDFCENQHVGSDTYRTHGANTRLKIDKRSNLTNFEKWHAYLSRVTDHYGMDCGRPDLDLGINDDHSAIDIDDALEMLESQSASNAPSPGKLRANEERDKPGHSKNEYYGSPVSINIPRYLSPLPTSLLKVPINLMYFHHFLDHTARVLVPHDCEDNPFSSVLPSSMPLFLSCSTIILTKQWHSMTQIYSI